jgi:N-methylhydantoinase B
LVLTGPDGEPVPDAAASAALRDRMRAARPPRRPFFDRGPGYARLSGGREAAEVDWL